MGQPNDLDGTDEQGLEDNALVRNLRADVAQAKSELKELRQYKAEAAEREQLSRKEAATAAVNTLGLPGLADDVLNWIEGSITAEAVAAVLKVKGIPMPTVVPETAPQGAPIPEVLSASKLGQAVASLAQGGGTKSVDQQLAEATNSTEIEAIMAGLGATRDYSVG